MKRKRVLFVIIGLLAACRDCLCDAPRRAPAGGIISLALDDTASKDLNTPRDRRILEFLPRTTARGTALNQHLTFS